MRNTARYREDKEAIKSLFKNVVFTNPLTFTLTMKQRNKYGEFLDSIKCPINFKHFKNRFDHEVFGNAVTRYGKRVACISVIENSKNDRLHYHGIIDNPRQWLPDKFDAVMKKCWLKTPFGHRKMKLEHNIYDSENWIDYCLKNRTKFGTLQDSIDFFLGYEKYIIEKKESTNKKFDNYIV